MALSTHSLESLGAGVEDAGITDASQTALDLAGSMTLLGWHRPTAIARIHTQQSKWLETGNQRSYRLLVNASNQIQYDYSDDGTAVRTAVSAAITSFAIDEHRHLAAVFISGTPEVQFYLDGLAFGAPVAIAGPGTVFNSTADYRVGNFDGGAAADNFRGQLDEIKLYSDERTAAEIFAEFQEAPVAGASLVAGYILDNALTDISGGVNTLVNNGTAFNAGEVHGYGLAEEADGRPQIAGDLDGAGFDIFSDLAILDEAAVAGGGAAPPVLSLLTPADASEITRTTQISFTLTDETQVSLACVFLKYKGANRTIMVYDSNGFRFPFDAKSSVVDVNSNLSRLDFKLNALGGWETDIEELVVIANDGNILTVI